MRKGTGTRGTTREHEQATTVSRNGDLVADLDTRTLILRDGARVIDGTKKYVVEFEDDIELPDAIRSHLDRELLEVYDACYGQFRRKLDNDHEIFPFRLCVVGLRIEVDVLVRHTTRAKRARQ